MVTPLTVSLFSWLKILGVCSLKINEWRVFKINKPGIWKKLLCPGNKLSFLLSKKLRYIPSSFVHGIMSLFILETCLRSVDLCCLWSIILPVRISYNRMLQCFIGMISRDDTHVCLGSKVQRLSPGGASIPRPEGFSRFKGRSRGFRWGVRGAP